MQILQGTVAFGLPTRVIIMMRKSNSVILKDEMCIGEGEALMFLLLRKLNEPTNSPISQETEGLDSFTYLLRSLRSHDDVFYSGN